MDKFSLDYETTDFRRLNRIRSDFFWTNEICTLREGKEFSRTLKIFNCLQTYLWWCSMLLIFVMTTTFFTYSKLPYDPSWPYSLSYIYTICFLIANATGYYIDFTRESFFSHAVLHGYFQMKVLISYLRVKFLRYKKMTLEEKIFSEVYQSRTKEILVRCIKHHQILTGYAWST